MKQIVTFKHPKIVTKGFDGNPNGYLIPIYNIHESPINKQQQPCQVYLTVVAPQTVKGPHLHMVRWGLFTCIKGNVKIITKTSLGYEEYFSGEDYSYQTVQVPAGLPAALQNQGGDEAFVLNMPSPAWSPENQDDHHACFSDYSFRS